MVVLTTHNRVQVHVYKRNVGCGECGLVKKEEVALEEEEVTKENHKKLIINKNLLTRNVNKKRKNYK